jgi:hypothetical protein
VSSLDEVYPNKVDEKRRSGHAKLTKKKANFEG